VAAKIDKPTPMEIRDVREPHLRIHSIGRTTRSLLIRDPMMNSKEMLAACPRVFGCEKIP
jgi:hypothetical protein